jgi:hypothetical protein
MTPGTKISEEANAACPFWGQRTARFITGNNADIGCDHAEPSNAAQV